MNGEPVTASTNSGVGHKELTEARGAAHNGYRTVGKVPPGHTTVKHSSLLCKLQLGDCFTVDFIGAVSKP